MVAKILKAVAQLVIVLIAFECVSPVFSTAVAGHNHFSFQAKKTPPSLFTRLAFEKAEERTEEEREVIPAEIVDLTRLATLLAQVHTPQFHVTPHNEITTGNPQLFKRYHVFLI